MLLTYQQVAQAAMQLSPDERVDPANDNDDAVAETPAAE